MDAELSSQSSNRPVQTIENSDSMSPTVIELEPLGPPEHPRHPHLEDFPEAARGTKEYREAVGHFFELNINYPVPSQGVEPENTVPASELSIEHTFKALDGFEKRRQISSASFETMFADGKRKFDSLDNYMVSSATVGENVCGPITMTKLCRTYNDLCKAIAEIEFSTSPLCPNSKALILAEKLATKNSFDIFKVLEDFQPPPRPKLPNEVELRLKESLNQTAADERESYVQRIQDVFVRRNFTIERMRELAVDWELWRVDALKKASKTAQTRTLVGKPTSSEGLWKEAKKYAFEKWEAELASTWDPISRLFSSYVVHTRTTDAIKSVPGTKRNKWESARSGAFLDDDAPFFRLLIQNSLRGVWERDWHRAMMWQQKKKPKTDDFQTRSPFFVAAVCWGMRCQSSLERVAELHEWIEDDYTRHRNDWRDDEWLLFQCWYTDIKEWNARRDESMHMVNDFTNTAFELIIELGKIDGSTSANNLNIFSPAMEDVDYVKSRVFDLIIDMAPLGDEERCIRHVNELLGFLAKKLRSDALKQGFDTLIKKQDHLRNTFMDFATVAIFFSSITATTLQFSFGAANESFVSTVVNVCWFASLVLSVSSATNSFLGAIVHQSPESLRPSTNFSFRFLRAWFKLIPPMLLSISGVLFLTGICAFTFLSTSSSPNQGSVTKHVTVILTSTNISTLLLLLLVAFTKVIQRSKRLTISAIVFPAEVAVALVAFCIPGAPGVVKAIVRYVEFPPHLENWIGKAIYLAMRVLKMLADRTIKDFTTLHETFWKLTLLVVQLWTKFKNAVRGSMPRSATRPPAP